MLLLLHHSRQPRIRGSRDIPHDEFALEAHPRQSNPVSRSPFSRSSTSTGSIFSKFLGLFLPHPSLHSHHQAHVLAQAEPIQTGSTEPQFSIAARVENGMAMMQTVSLVNTLEVIVESVSDNHPATRSGSVILSKLTSNFRNTG